MASQPNPLLLRLQSLDAILLERDRKVAIANVHYANPPSQKSPVSEISAVSPTSSVSTLVDIEASITDSQTTLVGGERSVRRFRSLAAEIGFCFSMAMSQLLAVSEGILMIPLCEAIKSPVGCILPGPFPAAPRMLIAMVARRNTLSLASECLCPHSQGTSACLESPSSGQPPFCPSSYLP